LVSVSTTMNSAVAMGASRSSMTEGAVIRRGPDGVQEKHR
jgi:hypothetical protein